MSGERCFVMMIKDRYWKCFVDRHQQGKQVHYYVQKGLAPPKQASLILFYVTKPVGEMSGVAEFVERKAGEVDEVWKQHGDESVLSSKGKFKEFIGDGKKASFIRFKNLREATRPVSLSNALLLLGVKRFSRKGFYIEQEVADELLSQMGLS
jgi:predicted transcriptional regulator